MHRCLQTSTEPRTQPRFGGGHCWSVKINSVGPVHGSETCTEKCGLLHDMSDKAMFKGPEDSADWLKGILIVTNLVQESPMQLSLEVEPIVSVEVPLGH